VRSLQKLYLIGMMGSGKSSTGRILASHLGWRFADLDEEIEKTHCLPVSEIWKRYGEQRFRQWELECVVQLAERTEAMVVACGGGIVTNEKARQILKGSKNGQGRTLCVYLRTSPWVLAERIWKQRRIAGTGNEKDAVDPSEAAESEEAAELRGFLSDRPLLSGARTIPELTARLTEILELRRNLYEETADLVLDTDRLTPEEAAKEILAAIEP
jgi:shikimate kinase